MSARCRAGWPERRRVRSSQVTAPTAEQRGRAVRKLTLPSATAAPRSPCRWPSSTVVAARRRRSVRAVAAVLGPTTGPKPLLPQSSGIGHAAEKLDLNHQHSSEASSHQIKTALAILDGPSRSLRMTKERPKVGSFVVLSGVFSVF